MKRYRPSYFVGQAFKGIFRNGMMSMASVIVLLACITVLGTFTILARNIDYNLESLDNLNQIVAFCDTTTGYEDGASVTLPKSLVSESGRTFLGWSLNRGSSTADYNAGAIYRMNKDNAKGGTVTLYAVWSDEETHDYGGIKMVYDYCGVKLAVTPEADETLYQDGDKIVLPSDIAASNTSISFLGWTSVYGAVDKEFAAGADYTVKQENAKGGTVVLYAVWSETPSFAEYSVAYDMSGETVENIPLDSEIRLEAAKKQFDALENVESVEFVSKEETLKSEMAQLSEYEGLQTLFEGADNPYPDTFIVTYAVDADTLVLQNTITSITDVYRVRCRADIAETIESLKGGVSTILFWFSVVLFAVSVLVIVNTVKLAVEYRGKEIEIMRYIGATKMFIAGPFELEGIIIGLFSGAISFGIMWAAYGKVTSLLVDEIQMISILPFGQIAPWLVPLSLVIGVATGFIGSTIAIAKYIKA